MIGYGVNPFGSPKPPPYPCSQCGLFRAWETLLCSECVKQMLQCRPPSVNQRLHDEVAGVAEAAVVASIPVAQKPHAL